MSVMTQITNYLSQFFSLAQRGFTHLLESGETPELKGFQDKCSNRAFVREIILQQIQRIEEENMSVPGSYFDLPNVTHPDYRNFSASVLYPEYIYLIRGKYITPKVPVIMRSMDLQYLYVTDLGLEFLKLGKQEDTHTIKWFTTPGVFDPETRRLSKEYQEEYSENELYHLLPGRTLPPRLKVSMKSQAYYIHKLVKQGILFHPELNCLTHHYIQPYQPYWISTRFPKDMDYLDRVQGTSSFKIEEVPEAKPVFFITQDRPHTPYWLASEMGFQYLYQIVKPQKHY